MEQTPLDITQPETSGPPPLEGTLEATPPPNRRPRLYAGRKRQFFIASLALLVVLILIFAWIGLTHQGRPTTQASASQQAATPISQVEPPRKNSDMAYDPIHHVVLLFGGLTTAPTQTNQTWAWDGHNWRQLHPAVSPPALQGSMAYDAASQRVILFLTNVTNGGSVDNQMWSWDGQNWQQLHPKTLPEVLSTNIVYDAARQQIVLFGGSIPHGRTSTYTNATWIWNGTTWQQQHPASSPSARQGTALAYDAAHQQVVLFGGITAQGISSETWTWNGTTWTKQTSTNNPSARQNTLLIYDSATRQILLFGGISSTGAQAATDDTWAWNGTAWSRIAAHGAPTAVYESAAYDESTHTIVVYVLTGDSKANPAAAISQTWTWNGTTWKILP